MSTFAFAFMLLNIDDLPKLTSILTTVMILATVCAFCALWIYILLKVWKTRDTNPPSFNDAVQYLAPVLIALVGGVVAMVFGVSISGTPHNLTNDLRALISFKPDVWIYGTYIVSYLVFGFASGVTWVAKSSVTPPLVKNFAMTTIGLVVAVVGASFGLKN